MPNLGLPVLPRATGNARPIVEKTGGDMDTVLEIPAVPPGEVPIVDLSDNPCSTDLKTLETPVAQDLVLLFKLLADETRLRILHYLMQKPELNVRTFVGLLGQTQPAVSHHLALLREAGVLQCRRDGKHNFYRLAGKRCQAFLDTAFRTATDCG
jgi:ArsR family transcriptional regulator